MVFFEFKFDEKDDGDLYRIDIWEERRCLICYSYKAKISRYDENNVLQTLQITNLEMSQYSTLNILKNASKEDRAKKYISKFIFPHIPLLPKKEKNEENNE